MTITTEAPTTTFQVGDAVQINNPYCDARWNVIGDVVGIDKNYADTGKTYYDVVPRVGFYAGAQGGFEGKFLLPVEADAITVHDVEGLESLPIGTRLVDTVGDIAEIRESDAIVRGFDWVELSGIAYEASAYHPLSTLAALYGPLTVQDPTNLDRSVPETPVFKVGDKARVLDNIFEYPVGFEGEITKLLRGYDGHMLYAVGGYDLLLASEVEEIVEAEEYVIHDHAGLDALPVGARIERLGYIGGEGYDKVEGDLWTHEAGRGARFSRFEPYEFPFRLANAEVLDEPVRALVFAKGTELVLVDGSAKNARPGSRAVVVEDCFEGDEWVKIHWTNVITSASFGQMDGNYFPSDFEVAEAEADDTEEPMAEWERELLGITVEVDEDEDEDDEEYGCDCCDDSDLYDDEDDEDDEEPRLVAGDLAVVTVDYPAMAELRVGDVVQIVAEQGSLGWPQSDYIGVIHGDGKAGGGIDGKWWVKPNHLAPHEVEEASDSAFVIDAEGMEAMPVGSMLRGTSDGLVRLRVQGGYVLADGIGNEVRHGVGYLMRFDYGDFAPQPLEVVTTPDAS